MPTLLDLFCGAGGASEGYVRAGFDVVGVDLHASPRYPFACYELDALEVRPKALARYDAIHASPPCQAFTSAKPIRGREHPDLLTPIRNLLEASGKPWVIENVPGAPMHADLLLCGSMFGLELKRHRVFELSWGAGLAELPVTPPCDHDWPNGRPVGVYGHTGGKATGLTSGNHGFLVEDWKRAMGITWMSRNELAQAIPPAYTEFVGRLLMEQVKGQTGHLRG